MRPQEIFDLLQPLPWQVVRGKDKGASPPTLGYDLRLMSGVWHVTLFARAYLMEMCDDMLDAGAQALGTLYFHPDKCEDGTEKDTGIFTKSMAFILRVGDIQVLADGTPIGGVTGYEWALHTENTLVRDVAGVQRRVPGSPSATLTLNARRLDADVGQLLLLQKAAGRERIAFTLDGTPCAGYCGTVHRRHDGLTADITLE
ncbi:MAG: hypothetical protein PHQ85_09175 [Eubacteriales bacterium]|nr:hypothetical protein [Eubacteriales bacterium]